jgi:hypothetical protein
MMEELVQKVSQKTGLAPEESQQVVNIIVNHFKERLPAPLASGLDSLLAGGSADGQVAGQADGSGLDALEERAKSAMASGLGGMFESKSES